MRKAAHIGLTVLGGGLLLGALLGAYADPQMKRAPEAELRLSARPAIEPGPAVHLVSFPEDLSPHIGYRPDLDYAAEIDDWSPRYPSWSYSDYDDGDEPADRAGFEDRPAWSAEPALPEPDGAATALAAETAEAPADAAASASPEGHRIARVQSDGLW